jgi:hypothetical protein
VSGRRALALRRFKEEAVLAHVVRTGVVGRKAGLKDRLAAGLFPIT